MNAAHWHLAINHIPLLFPLAGLIVLITGLVSKSEAVKRAAYLLFVLGAFSAIAAMSTGEEAEEIVEHMSGIEEHYIEEHEETAESFALLSYGLGAVALVGLWASFKEKSFARILHFVTLAFALIVIFYGGQTGTTGGEIRHTEIRPEK